MFRNYYITDIFDKFISSNCNLDKFYNYSYDCSRELCIIADLLINNNKNKKNKTISFEYNIEKITKFINNKKNFQNLKEFYILIKKFSNYPIKRIYNKCPFIKNFIKNNNKIIFNYIENENKTETKNENEISLYGIQVGKNSITPHYKYIIKNFNNKNIKKQLYTYLQNKYKNSNFYLKDNILWDINIK